VYLLVLLCRVCVFALALQLGGVYSPRNSAVFLKYKEKGKY